MHADLDSHYNLIVVPGTNVVEGDYGIADWESTYPLSKYFIF